ncbi:oxidoreductase [Streptomyces sp. NPDC002755]
MLQTRRLTRHVAEAISMAGFARHFVPARWGGSEGTFRHLLDAAAQLAETSASAAWCATLFATHGRLCAFLPDAGQHDLWASSPDTRIAAAVSPDGRAAARDVEWRLTGTWNYVSGIDWADWVLLGAWVSRDTDAAGEEREHRLFAVPRADVEVHDTWHSTGLRGTGSNTVTVDALDVPRHRSFAVADLATARPGSARCHSVPSPMVTALMLAAPALGVARAARTAWVNQAVENHRSGNSSTIHISNGRLRAFARASAGVHAAELLTVDVADLADKAAITPLTVARCRRDATVAAAHLSNAVDTLFRAVGTRGLAEDSHMQACWHDISAITAHVALDADTAAEDFARTELDALA